MPARGASRTLCLFIDPEGGTVSTNLRPDQGSRVAPRFDHAIVRDVMHDGVLACLPDEPAVELARIMAQHHVHAVVVAGLHGTGTTEELRWRVVTDHDVVRAASVLDGLTAGEVGGEIPLSVAPSTPLPEAAELMGRHGSTHLVVADQGRPIGVVSTLDVAGALAWGRG